MENYQPNSNRFKTEQKEKQEKKVEKVVTGKVITKKKSGLRKFTDEFISDDARNVKSYIFGDVIIPAVKKAVYDVITTGIDMILYGESRGGNRRSTADKVSYSRYSDRDYSSSRSHRSSAAGYSYDDIVLATRAEAEEVLDRMDEIINTYNIVSVADLKDLVGVTGNYTDNKYGWTSMRNASIERVRDGYWIKLPRAVPID